MSIFGTSKPSFFTATAKTATMGSNDKLIYVAAGHDISTSLWDKVLMLNASGKSLGVYDIGTVTSTTVFAIVGGDTTNVATVHMGYKLKYSTIEYDYIEPDQLNYTSVINGNKTNTHLGDYGNFRVTEFLWRYTSGGWTAKTRFTALYNFYHTNVYFAPHDDVILGSDSKPILCYLKTFKLFMYKGLNTYDGLTLEFDPNAYHDASKLI